MYIELVKGMTGNHYKCLSFLNDNLHINKQQIQLQLNRKFIRPTEKKNCFTEDLL